MRKLNFERIKKPLFFLLAVFFVISLATATVSARSSYSGSVNIITAPHIVNQVQVGVTNVPVTAVGTYVQVGGNERTNFRTLHLDVNVDSEMSQRYSERSR